MLSRVHNPRLVRIVLVIPFMTLNLLEAADALEQPVKAIVVSKTAQLMVGNEKLGSLGLGQLVEYDRLQGAWRFLPKEMGWIHKQDIVEETVAVEHFTKRIEQRPTPTDYHLRGIAYIAKEEWGKALLDLEKAYDLEEDSVSLHFNLGICYRQLGDFPAALREFTSIIEAHPDEFPAIMARGSLLVSQEHWRAAKKDFDQAIELNPDSADAHNLRGVVMSMLGELEEAQQEYSNAIEIDEEFAQAYANRAYVKIDLGAPRDAVKDYEKALELDPEDSEIQNDYAWLLATSWDKKVRDPKRALELSRQANASLEKPDGEYLDTLAAALAANEMFDDAVITASDALKILSGSSKAVAVGNRLKLFREKKTFVEQKPK